MKILLLKVMVVMAVVVLVVFLELLGWPEQIISEAVVEVVKMVELVVEMVEVVEVVLVLQEIHLLHKVVVLVHRHKGTMMVLLLWKLLKLMMFNI